VRGGALAAGGGNPVLHDDPVLAGISVLVLELELELVLVLVLRLLRCA
jgi:hypothetical protein